MNKSTRTLKSVILLLFICIQGQILFGQGNQLYNKEVGTKNEGAIHIGKFISQRTPTSFSLSDKWIEFLIDAAKKVTGFTINKGMARKIE